MKEKIFDNLPPEKKNRSMSLKQSEEKVLVEQLKNGRQRACDELVFQYQPRLLKLAFGITLDMEDSREVVQDVFINAIKNIHSFRHEAGLSGWLRKITINACLNWKRKWKRRFKWHHDSLESDNDPVLYADLSPGPDPESNLQEKQSGEMIFKAMGKLPEANRAVFVLSTFEGLSYDEIAQTLGISRGTVSSRLHYARKKILAHIEVGNSLKPGPDKPVRRP